MKDYSSWGLSNPVKNDKGICGVIEFAFTWGLVYGIKTFDYEGRYCYPKKDYSRKDVENILNNWDVNNHPKGDWLKHKGINIDEVNPKFVEEYKYFN